MPTDYLIAGRYDIAECLDRVTGERVHMTPSGRGPEGVVREHLARRLMALALPGIVPILHVGPGIIHAAPPSVTRRPRLPPDAAAVCALEACEVVAHLHALGVTVADSMTSLSLRIVDRGASWHIAWLLPGADSPGRRGEHHEPPSLPRDLQHLVRFFDGLLDLRPGITRAALLRRHGPPDPAVTALVEVLAGDHSSITDVVVFARLLAPLTEDPPRWIARINAWPLIRCLPPAPGSSYEDLIAGAEAMGARYADGAVTRDEHITLPLAAAYHKRAGQRFARCELAAALTDVDRALVYDDFPGYHTTRAVILDALGSVADAHAAITSAFASPALADPPASPPIRRQYSRLDPPTAVLSTRERARAHATRGTIALRRGDFTSAERDLRCAFDLDPTAAHAHALGAALYALGKVQAAADIEARSLTLPGALPRHRWALVVSLLQLGRRAEARAHADAIVAADPDSPSHRDRRNRLFGT